MVMIPDRQSFGVLKTKKLDGRSDIYSLGATLYHVLTGRRPFRGDSPVQTALMHIKTPLVPPVELNPLIPPLLDAAICRMMAKRPEDRFQSADDLIVALEEVEAALGIGSTPLLHPVAAMLAENTSGKASAGPTTGGGTGVPPP